jgi:1-deoxy-D-xylulose-5-phosphate synthase
VLLVPVGPMAGPACAAAEELRLAGLGVTVVAPRWVLPIEPALRRLAGRHRLVVTVEDGVVSGGFGDALAAALRADGESAELISLGLPPQFLAHGSRNALLSAAGLDAAGIAARVLAACEPVRRPADVAAVVSL